MGSLANSKIEPPQPALGMSTVKLLYGSLAQGDTGTVAGLLTEDLEWWFHGPPGSQHMMRVLTGECPITGFRFAPRSIATAGDMVFAEGWEGEHVYWVHVWTVQDGVITQFREYFNTWLTVKDLRRPQMRGTSKHGGPTLVWQSEPQEDGQRSLPGLILAICIASDGPLAFWGCFVLPLSVCLTTCNRTPSLKAQWLVSDIKDVEAFLASIPV